MIVVDRLGSTQRAVLQLIAEDGGPPWTADEVRDALGISRRDVHKVLRSLTQRGLLSRHRPHASKPYSYVPADGASRVVQQIC